MRVMKYFEAINEAFKITMRAHPRVFHIGVGVNTPWYVGNTMAGLVEEFGEDRIINTPVSENGTTGIAIGAGMTGMHPIVSFPRMDFMHYAMDQICNHAAIMSYSLGGHVHVAMTLRGIINRGGEQAAQHSQALQSVFMHIPGLKVVVPATPEDAKGLLISAIEEPNPVVYIEDRWLYDMEGEVPEGHYTVPIGKAKILRAGTDVTLLASSYMVTEAMKAADDLAREGRRVELVDIRCLKPLDVETILGSVAKTGRVVIADGTWRTGGVAMSIAGLIVTDGFRYLKAPVKIVTLPDLPAPASSALEKPYYPTHVDIAREIRELLAA